MHTARYYLRRGAPWQIGMIVIFLIRRLRFPPQFESLWLAGIIAVLTLAGLLIFTYCLYALYSSQRTNPHLVTGGVFRFTRHPMYLAFALMDSSAYAADLDVRWLISTLVFYSFMIRAGYWQEQETLARFGSAAQEYYARTSRYLFF